MNCKYCNAELVDGMPFCPACGKKQEETEEILVEAAAEAAEEAAQAAEISTPESEEVLPFETDAFEEVEEEAETPKKASPKKIATAVIAIVMLLSVLIGLVAGSLGGIIGGNSDPTIAPTAGTVPPTEPIEIPSNGDPASPLCKASYTVSDEAAIAAADTVVATMGDRVLTNGELQAFYWQEVYMFLSQNGMYAEYLGLDLTAPLEDQVFTLGDTPMSWQQFFLDGAISTWKTYQAMELESEAANFQLTEEQQEELDGEITALRDAAAAQGFASSDALLSERIGAGCTEQAYANYSRIVCYCMSYYDHYSENVAVTEDEITDFFTENEEYYTSAKINRDSIYVDVRHVLLQPEGGETGEDGYPVYTDEAWEACRLEAERIYTQWQEGDRSEESFAQLAVDHSVDGNASTGGLYQNVYEGQMVENFENWCFDEARVVGDHGLVKTQFGYHIMFFCGSRGAVEYDLRGELAYGMMNAAPEKYQTTVDFSLIELDALNIA